MMNLRVLLVVTALATTGCSGLFGEFPDHENRDPGNDFAFQVGPPSEVSVGDDFPVVLNLVDENGEALAMEGIELDLSVSDGEFASGDVQVSASSDETGTVEFSLNIEEAGQGLVLTATSEHEDFANASLSTEPFDVVGVEPLAEQSAIDGETGTIADGEDEATITIELVDEFGNGVAGVIPEFEATGEGNDYQECSETDENGVATCLMTSTVDEEKTLKITDPVQVTGETIEFWLPCEDETAFGGGDGSGNDPYRICTPEHLNEIHSGTNALEKDFVVARDLDMVQVTEFNIIGDDVEPFSGQFDGRGFTIQNLKIESPDDYVGIFGAVDENALIEDIVLEDIEVSGRNFVGSLAGANSGRITNCSAAIEVTGKASANNTEDARGGVGGLVGSNSGSITNCTVDVDIEGEHRFVGGLVGRSENEAEIKEGHATGVVVGGGEVAGLVGYNQGEISDSSAEVNITGQTRVGGLVGWNVEGSVIDNSSASGDLDYEETDDYSDGQAIGGLVGSNAGEITRSHAEGIVDGRYVSGGFAGMNFGTIDGCFSTGSVKGEQFLGGLVGYNQEPVHDSHATGTVDGKLYVGGLIGALEPDAGVTDPSNIVTESYATGEVTGRKFIGGLIGRCEGELVDTYATGNVSGDSVVGGLVGELGDNLAPGRVLINRSYATGSVAPLPGAHEVEESGSFGGLVGYARFAEIDSSFATGKVEGTTNTGGLVGRFFYGSIVNSYATGSVDVVGDDPSGGGLVGRLETSSSDGVNEISTSYAAGAVTGAGDTIGGFGGVVDDDSKVEFTACYWDEETTGADRGIGSGSDTGITGLDDGFDSAASFDAEHWVFEGDEIEDDEIWTWTIGEAPDGLQRPILLWQEQ